MHVSRFVVVLLGFVAVSLCAGEPGKPPTNPNPPDPPSRPDVGQWKTKGEGAKDDKHWYPEFPDNKVLNESLVNGSFEEAANGVIPYPKGWAHPDNYCIFWMKDPMAHDHGKVIVLDTDHAEGSAMKAQTQLREALASSSPLPASPAEARGAFYGAIAGTYGVSFYSEKFKCKPAQPYKITFDYKGASGGAKVWVRGWGTFQGEERRRFETIVNCRVKGTGWAHFEQCFYPSRRRGVKDQNEFADKEKMRETIGTTDVTFLRVMLYAYWPPGQYSFDNVKVEEISEDEYKRLKAIPADEK